MAYDPNDIQSMITPTGRPLYRCNSFLVAFHIILNIFYGNMPLGEKIDEVKASDMYWRGSNAAGIMLHLQTSGLTSCSCNVFP